jgi:hypothetical protein
MVYLRKILGVDEKGLRERIGVGEELDILQIAT